AHAGLRFNYITLDATFDDKTFFPFPYQTASQRNGALSGALGLVYLPNDKSKLSLLASTGFRAPNVDDLAKVFETVPGTLIVPNPDLRPEYTQNGELSLSQWFGQTARLELSTYYSHLSNAIVLDAFRFNGQDSIPYEGTMSKVFANQNKREAFIAGVSAHLDIFFTAYLSLRGSWNYTRGRILEEGGSKPLDHIPPVFGQLALQFEKEKLRAECSWMFNGKKDIKDYLLNAEDNERYATPDGMPAWNTLHLRLGYALHRSLDIQAACENLFDANYRVFASGVSAPGRNVRLTLRTRF
ncbi:MAG: TonB-dependent receptor domain-containing protein, partial [Saprospiraceae bacterium]